METRLMRVRTILLATFLITVLPSLAMAGNADNPRCIDKAERGPCKARFDRYGYDSASGTCKEITWGGCGEPLPFETKEECLQVCGGIKPLVITEVKAYPDKNLPYVLVSIEYPKKWQNPNFTVRVNDLERPFRPWGGGYSPDKQDATLLVFPGAADFIRITVQASVDGQTYESSDAMQWTASSMAGLLDGPGRLEAVRTARPLRFWAFPADRVRVRFNGQPVTPARDPLSGKPVGLFSLAPQWVSGKNTLVIETTGQDGISIGREYTFIYLADATVALHDTLNFVFGIPGSKSGPFYSFDVAGDALVRTGKVREESYATVDPEGWLVNLPVLVQTVRAERPGEARVRFMVKRHFLQAVELDQEFTVKVVPAVGR
jgi:hypothetical protein